MIQIWSELSADTADKNMPQEILTRLGGHISVHPWWHARARLVEKIIQLHFDQESLAILDVGCGWGVTLKHLETLKHNVWGLDVGIDSLKMLDGPGRQLILGDIENGLIPEEIKGRFDSVLALDVLEHLDHPEQAMKKLIQLTRPGGLIIITVPALMELWSEFDEIQGHRKRFEKQDIAELLENTGELRECKMGYCWPWLVTMARLTRQKNAANSIHNTERDVWKTYEKYVKPGPRLFRWLMALGFRLSERQALMGTASQGTTILAMAIRN